MASRSEDEDINVIMGFGLIFDIQVWEYREDKDDKDDKIITETDSDIMSQE